MGIRMANKVALISGSTRGIGRSIAELFAAEGAKVAVTGRTVDRGKKVVDRIVEAGGEAEFFELDVTSEQSVHDVMEATVARFGALHTLVNNAAPTADVATMIKPLHEYSTEEWDRILTGTLTGNVFWATKYAWPHLAAAPGASIISISSTQSVEGFVGFAPYSAAKAAINGITRSLAAEGSVDGIRANAIIVGRVVSSQRDTGVHTGGGRLTRIGNPMDIAYTATWLASDEAAFTTGSLVTVDGGYTINGDAAAGAQD
jgi:meso-butanediol dehydrogenase/(S,S)-butanediol dehydrogenase/diacetyl reductase